MDLAFLLFPKFFKKKDTSQLTSWTRYSVKKAKKIIAISANTKKDIQRYYHTPSEKIIVAYPGHSSYLTVKDKENQSILSKYKLDKGYILFVGTIQPRKNLIRLIQAFENLKEENHLVIAGKKGWIYKDIERIIEYSPKKDKIHQLGFVPQGHLPSLIKSASCLVLPGLYEGFGIPPLESIHLGTIPVVSRTGSLPEVVGENGLIFDPFSIDSITKAIKNAIKLTTSQKKVLINKLKSHARKFSWESSAKVILEVLDEVAIQR
jgi:glycosyltransferase involved in cell wall biosynthesis